MGTLGLNLIDNGSAFSSETEEPLGGEGLNNGNFTGEVYEIISPPPSTGSMSGIKFRDDNNNGIFEPNLGEVGLPGFTIYVDSNSNGVLDSGEFSDVSDGNGNYQIANLAPGIYTVAEVRQTGFTATTAALTGVQVTANQTTSAIIGIFRKRLR